MQSLIRIKKKKNRISVGQKDRLSVHTKKRGGARLGVEFLWFCRSRDEGERRDERGEDDGAGGEARGAHAHKELLQFIVAASGSFEVILDDGHNKRTIFLNRPYMGLLVLGVP